MSNRPATHIRHDREFEDTYALFVHLEENSTQAFWPDAALMLMEAFDELTDRGREQVGQLFTLPPGDYRTVLATLESRLAQLLANSTGLDVALRYTRALDLVRAIGVR